MRGAEPVEEVEERYSAAEGGRVRDECEVVRLLHRRRRQQGEAGLTHGHDVGVVTEDRQRLCRRSDRAATWNTVEGELPGDLVHVRDHEQQTLRRRVGRTQRPTLQRADRAGRAGLALHLDDRRNGAPDVGPASARPVVGQLGHRRARGDRVDGAQLGEPVSDVDRRLVAVDGAAHGSNFRNGDRGGPPAAGALRARTMAPGGGNSLSATISMACTGHCR